MRTNSRSGRDGNFTFLFFILRNDFKKACCKDQGQASPIGRLQRRRSNRHKKAPEVPLNFNWLMERPYSPASEGYGSAGQLPHRTPPALCLPTPVPSQLFKPINYYLYYYALIIFFEDLILIQKSGRYCLFCHILIYLHKVCPIV